MVHKVSISFDTYALCRSNLSGAHSSCSGAYSGNYTEAPVTSTSNQHHPSVKCKWVDATEKYISSNHWHWNSEHGRYIINYRSLFWYSPPHYDHQHIWLLTRFFV